MGISENLAAIRSEIGNTTLVAVSKTKPAPMLLEAFQAGQRVFGENYVQEAAQKKAWLRENLSKEEFLELRFHFIGHLQSNKAKQAVETFDVIQTLDRQKLVRLLSKYCLELEKEIDVFVQVNTSGEESKSGVSPDETLPLCRAVNAAAGLRLRGLMCIGAAGHEADFVCLRELRQVVSEEIDTVRELSMGMSSDYLLAIEHGSTMVRVGSSIFGARK